MPSVYFAFGVVFVAGRIGRSGGAAACSPIEISAHARNSSCGPQPTAPVLENKWV